MQFSYLLLLTLFSLLARGAALAQQLPPRLIGTGRIHSVLIAADGTLYGWGQWTGGNDTVFYSPVPRLMPGAGAWTWRQVAAGNDYTLAIRQDGTLWAWGGNGAGSLGDGIHTSRYWPVQVGHANDWRRISAYNTSLGVRTDGTL